MKKYLSLLFLLAVAISCVACGDVDTPTEAYKRLYAAVKSKNTEAIKGEMSQTTQSFAEFVASQQKKTLEEVFANGFTQTTFAETLPEIRDERVNGKMGALEVWNAKGNTWDDLPFVLEGSVWKLAVGDAFRGNWTSPGKGRSAREIEAANGASGNNLMINGMANVNSRSNSNINK